MGSSNGGRTGRAWRALCARVCAEEEYCLRCGRWVDQTLPPRTPQSRSVDHVTPLALGGPLLARWNVALAHYSCNSRHGAILGNVLRARGQGRTRQATIIIVDPDTV